jgi:hypothetical protein
MNNVSRFPGTTLRADLTEQAIEDVIDGIAPCFDKLCDLLNEASLEAMKARDAGANPMAADEIELMICEALTAAENLRRDAKNEAVFSLRESLS